MNDGPPSPSDKDSRLVINQGPLRSVPSDRRWLGGLGGARTRELQRRIWVALGGDPAAWDEEHPGG